MPHTPNVDAEAPSRTHANRGRPALAMLFRLGIGFVLLLVAGGIFGVLYATKAPPPERDDDTARLTVSVMTALLVEAPLVWNAYGTARAKSASEIGAEISGVVAERPAGIDPGRAVKAGDLIVRIESREYRDRVTQAEARIDALKSDLDALTTEAESLDETLALAQRSVELTQKELERFVNARTDAGINEIEIDRLTRELNGVRTQREELKRQVDLIPSRRLRLEAQLSQERAGLRLAELDVERTEIRSPIDGVLQSVEVDDGERVSPGQPVARVVDLRRVEVPVRAPLSSAPALREGDPVRLTTGVSTGPVWEGSIERIAPEADQRTRTLTVFVVVEQTPGVSQPMLLPGQYLSARLASASTRPRVILPRASVDGDRVVVLDDQNRAQIRDVTVAYHLEGTYPSLHPNETQWSAIVSGVEPGDRIVLQQTDLITPDLPLEPAPVLAPLGTASNGGEPESTSAGAS